MRNDVWERKNGVSNNRKKMKMKKQMWNVLKKRENSKNAFSRGFLRFHHFTVERFHFHLGPGFIFFFVHNTFRLGTLYFELEMGSNYYYQFELYAVHVENCMPRLYSASSPNHCVHPIHKIGLRKKKRKKNSKTKYGNNISFHLIQHRDEENKMSECTWWYT